MQKTSNSKSGRFVNVQKISILLFFYGLLFVFLYYPACKWLFATWSHDKPYSHGFFVPFIFFYLVWIKREQLIRIPPRPAWLSGGLILCACCVLLLVGRIGAIIQLEVISLYFVIPGMILFIWGWGILRALWFPIFYLQFMIPWIDPFLNYVYPIFRHIAATLGAWFLSFRYPVMLDGTFIYLPNISLAVIDACSGINFFISVTAVGLLLAYLTQKSWKRVIIVVIAGGLVTVFANGVRVALAGIMGQEFGADMLHGPGHIFRGWFVAQVGWVAIFFINWLISKVPISEKYYLYERWKIEVGLSANQSEINNDNRTRLSSVLLYGILFCFGIYLNYFSAPVPVTLNIDSSSVPMEIGDWQGRDLAWLKSDKYFPGVNRQIIRSYQDSAGRIVYLYIGYFAAQRVNGRLISYHNRFLFQGKKIVPLATGEMGYPKRVGLSRAKIGSHNYQILSWYQFADTTLVNYRKVKIKGVVDAFIHHRNNGAIVLVASPVFNHEVKPVVTHDLVSFAILVAPEIRAMFAKEPLN